jgi:hypothetical protein
MTTPVRCGLWPIMVSADQSRPDGRLCAAKTMESQSLSRADPSRLASGASDPRKRAWALRGARLRHAAQSSANGAARAVFRDMRSRWRVAERKVAGEAGRGRMLRIRLAMRTTQSSDEAQQAGAMLALMGLVPAIPRRMRSIRPHAAPLEETFEVDGLRSAWMPGQDA